jgi:hypothetical protein
MLWWRVRLDHGRGLLTSKLALLWRCVLLHEGKLSMGSCLLPPLTSAVSLEREDGIQPQHRRPWWNYHHGLSGRSVLYPWCGCDGSMQSPRVAPPMRGEAKAPSLLDVMRNSSMESSIMARHGDGVLL